MPGERTRIDGHFPGECRLRRLSDGATAGSLAVRTEGDVLVIESLCIDPELRGYGLGTDAARAVLRAAEAGAWRLLRAWAPPDRGLAVYFWSRMGFRPLHGEGPDGGIWFERDVS